MGAYLSTPVTDKEVFEGAGHAIAYGGGSMQGWRRTMEDAHIAEVGLSGDPACAIFGVFDGHGGAEVAKFCQKYMALEVTKLERFGQGAIEDSLVEVFHRMDDMLRDHAYAEELEQLKTRDEAEDDESRGEGEGDGAVPMDALEMIKRVFQIKRWQGDGPGPGGLHEGADVEGDLDEDAVPGTSNAVPVAGVACDSSADADGGKSTLAGSDAGGMVGSSQLVEPADMRVQAGCTAVVAVKYGSELFVANAGDSRGVLCRAGQALALSEDHKPAQETERTRILNAGVGLKPGMTRAYGGGAWLNV
jgi:protein phosphatase 1G